MLKTQLDASSQSVNYPLRFEPIYQYRLWGGRRLSALCRGPLPGRGPIGEAWLLSDRDDFPSVVAEGPLQGRTIAHLMDAAPEQLLGPWAGRFRRFPLLLKFLDAHTMLSVQVHPSDHDRAQLPAGEPGKTEAWVVLRAGAESRVYAGLKPGTTADDLRMSLTHRTIGDHLVCIRPKPGDGVFLPAGMVHSLGGDLVVFEVQQNSDVTFRLSDWDRIDPSTGRSRELQVEQALACIDFTQGTGGLVQPLMESPMPVKRERYFQCDYFSLWRLRGQAPFSVGAPGLPRIVVCVEGAGLMEHDSISYRVAKGDVWLLPAAVGRCVLRPQSFVTLLEVALPQTGDRVTPG